MVLADYCYKQFGATEGGYVLKDNDGNLFEVVKLNLVFKRGSPEYVKVENEGSNKIDFKLVI